MEKSKVYFTDFRTVLGVSLTAKLQKLIKKAGIESIDMDGKFVAIKMHFGELGNLAYLRPNYAKAVADVVKELGGHGVGLGMHEDPFVDHTAKKGEGVLLVPGMVFTIEPMINAGSSEICIDDEDGWTIYTWDGNLSAQWEYTLLMTEFGVEILAR